MSEAGLYWLIPLALIIVLVGMGLLVRAWIHSSRAQITRAGGRLRRFAAELTRLESTGRDFTPEETGPYARPASELSVAIETIHRQLKNYSDHYFAIRKDIRRAELTSVLAVLQAPLAWYAIRRRIAVLLQQSDALEEALQAAQSTAEQLQRMGWQVAQKARDFDACLEQASEIAHDLHKAGVKGAAFQEAIRTGGRLRSVVQSIPLFFFSSEPEAVIAEADKATIIQIDQLLEENRPALDELLANLEVWKRQYDEASGHLATVAKTVDDLRSLTLDPPVGLQLDRAEARLHQMAQTAADLRNRLAAPDVEALRSLVQEARTTARTAQADMEQVDTARQQIGELQAGIRSLKTRLEEIGSAMSVPERKEYHPLAWDRSRPALAVLQEKLAAIGSPTAARLPEQVVKDLATVKELTNTAGELSRRVAEASERYDRLVARIETIDPKPNAERYAAARRLALRTPGYAPENWPKADAVAAFPKDVAEFLRRVEVLVPPDPGAPLLESRLEEQLAAAEESGAQHAALFGRAERIEKRLADMESLETEAEQKLNLVVSLFNQVDTLGQTNPVLALVVERADTERLWQEGQRLADELFKEERRRQGKVEKKAQKVDAFFRRVEAAANSWLARVQAEVAGRRTELAGKLDRLSQIATLEDPPVISAERLLAEEVEPPAKGVTVDLPQLMSELKSQNDVFLRLNSALEAVETEVETEVVEAYEAGVRQRQACIDKLEEAYRQLPGSPVWPPTTQKLDEEVQAFEEVEGRWEALRAGPLRANRLILLLGEIARGYQAVEAQIDRRLERAESERDRIAALEQSIDESVQMWQAQAGRWGPESQAAVDELLGEVAGRLEGLRQQVKQGRASYAQVEQELRALSREINEAQIPAGDGLIDINGD